MNKYSEQAKGFLAGTGTVITKRYVKTAPYFVNDAAPRDVYRVILHRKVEGKSRRLTFTIGASLYETNNHTVPSDYTILSCLPKNAVSTSVWGFIHEYGYVIDGDEAFFRAWSDCIDYGRRWKGVLRLFQDCLDELRKFV